MTKKYDIAVLIGRFQPLHNAHLELIRFGLKNAQDVVVVLGSHDSPRTPKNPWSSEERMTMILDSLAPEEQERMAFLPVEDTIYSDSEWVASVSSGVESIASQVCSTSDPSISIVSHNKDETSYYLDYFKQWDTVEWPSTVNASVDGPAISATKIRELFFEGYSNLLPAACPAGTVNFLSSFTATDEYAALKQEYDDAVDYDAQYQNVPYGQINFLTADAVVVQSGHVLLVQRAKSPGKGLWALPGGHVEPNETIYKAAVRELRQETNIKVPDKVLNGSVVYQKQFDHPDRSLRGRIKKKFGRTVTTAFVFKLNDSESLPKVAAADDAADAWWFSFAELRAMRKEIFEDHYDIAVHCLNRL